MNHHVLRAAVAAVVVLALGRFPARGGERALPEGKIRVEVRDVLRENDTVVTQVVVFARPGSIVRVVGDQPDSGGASTRAADAPHGGSPAKVTITIFGDRLTGQNGADLFRFLVRNEWGSSHATTSTEGPTPRGVKFLRDILSVKIESGEYREGRPVPLYGFQGQTFSPKVDPPVTSVAPLR